jgi:hypothetical protein
MRALAAIGVVVIAACGSFGGSGTDNTPAPTGDGGATDSASKSAVDSGPSIFSVPCSGAGPCSSPELVCCEGSCINASACASSNEVYQCNDSEDCAAAGKPSSFCCGRISNSLIFTGSCRTACPDDERRLCNPARGDEQCEPGKHCSTGFSPDGFGVCE